ncbi:MAG: hypothetical protein A2V88_12455 [Elusimicrobia bacterium RBG_16_66_12]|nr:MAG: hypothetical protein A2V88_12455 [Elusimicrobia bacterium RBG_16_66_12]
MGMGGAFTAVSDDVAAIHWNPAGLAVLKRQQLGMMYDHGLADIETEFIGYALPILSYNETLSGTLFARKGLKQAVGVSILASQLGKMELVRTDAGGAFQDSRTISAGNDMVVSLAYAARVTEDYGLIKSGGNEFHVGAIVRHWKSTLAEQYSARTTVFDFGCLSLRKEHGFRWGLVVQNLGSGLKYKEKTDPLPLTYRLGGAWQSSVPAIGAKALTVAVDGTADRENKKGVAAGFEYWSRSFAGWRAGYQWDQSNQSRWTAGLGIKLPGYSTGSIILDYGFQMINDVGTTQRVSLTCEFGAPR